VNLQRRQLPKKETTVAPKTFIFIALILSGVSVFNIPAASLTQSSDKSGMNSENQARKDPTEGQKLLTDQDFRGITIFFRGAFIKSKAPLMYATNLKIITAEGMVALQGPVVKIMT